MTALAIALAGVRCRQRVLAWHHPSHQWRRSLPSWWCWRRRSCGRDCGWSRCPRSFRSSVSRRGRAGSRSRRSTSSCSRRRVCTTVVAGSVDDPAGGRAG
jgi:hypothetical protein